MNPLWYLYGAWVRLEDTRALAVAGWAFTLVVLAACVFFTAYRVTW